MWRPIRACVGIGALLVAMAGAFICEAALLWPPSSGRTWTPRRHRAWPEFAVGVAGDVWIYDYSPFCVAAGDAVRRSAGAVGVGVVVRQGASTEATRPAMEGGAVRWFVTELEVDIWAQGDGGVLDAFLQSLAEFVGEAGGECRRVPGDSSAAGWRLQQIEVGTRRTPDGVWICSHRLRVALRHLAMLSPARPVIALVIDDLGHGVAGTLEVMALDCPLTLAILPWGRDAAGEARQAHAAGHEVIVHLPMEPQDPAVDPGTRAVRTSMTDAEIEETVSLAVRAVPFAVGMSNHMGSLATADERVMESVVAAAGREGLFFLDSGTSPDSVIGEVARRLGVPWAVSSLFVDNDPEVEAIEAQIRVLMALARKSGAAVGIGHVRPATAQAIRRMLPELNEAGVRLVYVSELVAGRPTCRAAGGGMPAR